MMSKSEAILALKKAKQVKVIVRAIGNEQGDISDDCIVRISKKEASLFIDGLQDDDMFLEAFLTKDNILFIG